MGFVNLSGFTTIDQKIAELFNNNFGLGGDWPWGNLILGFISVILSVLLCSFIGLEREKRGRSAGLRTHLLVGVGSCIIMIISIYGFPKGSNFDVARLAAGVVTGVGFLGAGAIIHNHGGIRGLTTASTVWMVMAIGLACGSMNFILALGGTLVVMIVLVCFRKVEVLVTKSCPFFIVLTKANTPIMTHLFQCAKKMNCTLEDVNSSVLKDDKEPLMEVIFKLSQREGKAVDVERFKTMLEENPDISNVEILNHH